MIFKFILSNREGKSDSFEVFLNDQDYLSYLKPFKDDFSEYEFVNVYKMIDKKLIFIEKKKIESL